MATNPQARPRSLEVERAQAEERMQRLEQQKHQLEIRKHELEKSKISVDVLKHFVTVITAILFILSYFGTQIFPILRDMRIPFSQTPLLELLLMVISSGLLASLVALGLITLSPDNENLNGVARLVVLVEVVLLGIAAMVFILAMGHM